MPDINITVAHKVAVSDTQTIVCDNSDYMVHWTLDEDWSAYDTKTMRTIYMDGTYEDKVFSGDTIALPVCTVPGAVQIGLFAGDIRASRMAILRALPSVRSAAGAPADPPESVYDQLMAKLNELGDVDPDTIAQAVADYLTEHPIEENDPTVPKWAKANEKPTYTATEVGAIAQADLQAATDAALAQAKSSGEFDGATGPAGPQGPAGAPGKDGAGMDITGATVGQIARITAVDTDGKPTAWSPVDMAGGEELTWHGWDNVIVPEGGLNAFDFTVLASGEKLSDHKVKGMFIYSPFAASAADKAEAAAYLIVNEDYKFNLATFVRDVPGHLRILLTVENSHLVVRYYKRDSDNSIVFPAPTVTINMRDLNLINALSKSAVAIIGYGQTLLQFNQIQSVKIDSIGAVAKGVEFDVQVLY